MCEKTLIQKIKSDKDENTFNELTSLYESQIKRYFGSRFRSSPVDIQEAYNKLLLKIWTNIDSFREESSFKTWIFQIARNIVSDEFNKINKRNSIEVPIDLEPDIIDEIKSPDAQIIDRETNEEIQKKILSLKSSLTQKHLRIFELIFESGLSYKETSEKLNCSIGTIRSRVFYTRKKIQDLANKCQQHLP